MQLTDELLSGFLDASLSEAEMALVRQQLLEDESLVDRLASLAMVDVLVQQHARQIEQTPIPEAITALLHGATTPETAEVIPFPWWRRASQQLQRHAAAVACVALLAGYGIAQWLPDSGNSFATQLAVALDSTPSGRQVQVQDQQLTPQLSFINHSGEFCRYVSLQSATQLTETIACLTTNGWQQQASITVAQHRQAGGYHTASAVMLLDPMLDQLMAGQALDATAEQRYLKSPLGGNDE